MDRNPALDTDSYKLAHDFFYPPEMTGMHSYFESRGGRYASPILFGVQAFLLNRIGQRVTRENVEELIEFAPRHGLPVQREMWEAVVDKCDGFLPVTISSVDEGVPMPQRTPLLTVSARHGIYRSLASNIETMATREIYYASTVCTRLFNMKRQLKAVWEATADDLDGLEFGILDFSSRGTHGADGNLLGAAAYLMNFMGSDSLPAIRYTNHYYHCEMSGFSVPATEHSVQCAWGEARERESFSFYLERVAELVAQGKCAPILSIVGDTWNVFRAVEYFGELAPRAKELGITMVFRPDSGTPTEVLPGLIPSIARAYGTTRNSKGFDEFNGAKLLWGDGVDETTHLEPVRAANELGISAKSIMTGSGGGLMTTDLTRDTCKWAFKGSAIEVDEKTWHGIAKDPVTDTGKRSKRGRQAVVQSGEQIIPVSYLSDDERPVNDLMTMRYSNGAFLNQTTADEIRARLNAAL